MSLPNSITISHNMILGAVCAVVQISANLVSYPIFLYYLGYRRYGVWLTLAVILNIIQFVSAGIGPALMQAVAHSLARSRREQVVQFVFWSLAGTACAAVVLLLLWPAAVAVTRTLGMDADLSAAVVTIGPWLAGVAALLFAAECAGAIAAGAGKIHRVYIATAAGQVLLLAVSAALLHAGAGLGALIAAFAAARCLVLLILAPAIARAAASLRGFRPSFPVLAEVLHSGGWMLAGTGLNVFLVPLSRWAIAATTGVAAVPVFDIAYTGSMQIRNVLEFGLRSLVPEAAALQARGNGPRVLQIYSVWTRRMLFAGAALYGLAALAAPWVLELWLAGRLAPGQVGIFRLFLFAGFFSLLGTPAFYLLVGSRKLTDVFWSYVVQAAVNGAIILAAVLWPASDVVRMAGVAMGTAMLASTVLLMQRLKKIGAPGEGAEVKDPACCPV